jgi:hypothetical protein
MYCTHQLEEEKKKSLQRVVLYKNSILWLYKQIFLIYQPKKKVLTHTRAHTLIKHCGVRNNYEIKFNITLDIHPPIRRNTIITNTCCCFYIDRFAICAALAFYFVLKHKLAYWCDGFHVGSPERIKQIWKKVYD